MLATALDQHLPLHVQNPPVDFISWEAADEIMRLGASYGDEKIWFAASAVYRDKACARKVFEDRAAHLDVVDDALLSAEDVELLLDAKFATKAEATQPAPDENIALVKFFSVVEEKPEGSRRRIIAWPRSINDGEKRLVEELLEKHAVVKFDSAAEVRDRGATATYAAHLDFKKFYQQFELLVKNYWAFEHAGQTYFLATVPTGAVLPPLFANALSRTLLALSVRQAGVAHLVGYDCCIDNLRLTSDNLHALRAAWNQLLELCAKIGATIGEQTPPPANESFAYTYLGMRFICGKTANKVELSEKSKNKLSEAIATLESNRVLQVIDVLSIFGKTVWASTVTGFELSRLYHVIKFVRRAQRKPLDSTVKVWPSIIGEWCAALREAKTRQFTPLRKQPGALKVTMYTDASESGWGVVIIGLGKRSLRIFGGKWSEAESKRHINELELRAIRIGLRILESLADEVSCQIAVRILVDNTSAIAWAKKRRAPNYAANKIALDIDSALRPGKIDVESIDYVESAKNFADGPSRGKASQLRPPKKWAKEGGGE